MIDVHGGKAGYHPGLYKKHLDEIRADVQRGTITLTLDEMRTKAMETSCEEYKASLFMRLANEGKFKDLKNQLDDMNLFNREAYPKTMDQALRYLQNYKGKRGSSRCWKPQSKQKPWRRCCCIPHEWKQEERRGKRYLERRLFQLQ